MRFSLVAGVALAYAYAPPKPTPASSPAFRAGPRRVLEKQNAGADVAASDAHDGPLDLELDPEAYGGGSRIDLEPKAPGSKRRGASEFELNLGRALDVLRADVPDFPDRELDWSIYTPDVQLADPSGVQTRGLSSYKQFFSMIRLFRRVMISDATVTYRLRYDWSGKRIIVTWYSAWTARGSRTPAHVDAVSYFYLDDAGLVYKHEVDRVEINGQDMSPPYSTSWLLFRQYVMAGLDGGMPAPAAPSWFDREAPLAIAPPPSPWAPPAMLASGDGAAVDGAAAKKKAKPGRDLRKKTPKQKLLPGTCENMWDCESPMQCCDFLLVKICCNGGIGTPVWQPQGRLVPIPIPVERSPGEGGFPGGGPPRPPY